MNVVVTVDVIGVLSHRLTEGVDLPINLFADFVCV
jgi:hypothetical protein